jgi:hypothetical protein
MATLDTTDQMSLAGIRLTGQTLLMATFTLVEVLAVGFWLTLVLNEPPLSGGSILGFVLLAVGLLAKNVLTDAAVNGLSLDIPAKELLGISVSEAFHWSVWLGIALAAGGVTSILIAGLLFAVVLVPQHTIEHNILRGADPFETVFDLETVGFTLVQAAGATLWLLFAFEGELFRELLQVLGLWTIGPGAVGLTLLAAALFIEHEIGLALARQE